MKEKTATSGVRFVISEIELIKKRQGLNTLQEVFRFLVTEYMKLYKVEKPSIFLETTKESYDGSKVNAVAIDEIIQQPTNTGNYFGTSLDFKPVDTVSEAMSNISNAESTSQINEYLLAAQKKLTPGKFSMVKTHAEKIRQKKGFVYDDV